MRLASSAMPYWSPIGRYIFKDMKRVGMQELGPKFTLKLRSLQQGTFDSKYGEYLWRYEVTEVEAKMLDTR
jgi:ribosome production factor 1